MQLIVTEKPIVHQDLLKDYQNCKQLAFLTSGFGINSTMKILYF